MKLDSTSVAFCLGELVHLRWKIQDEIRLTSDPIQREFRQSELAGVERAIATLKAVVAGPQRTAVSDGGYVPTEKTAWLGF